MELKITEILFRAKNDVKSSYKVKGYGGARRLTLYEVYKKQIDCIVDDLGLEFLERDTAIRELAYILKV